MRIIGTLFSLPQVFLFFVVWMVASLAKPLVVLSLLAVATNPSAAWRKFVLFLWTIQYMILCNDKKWSKPKDDPDSYFANADEKTKAKIQRKTIIFVRHGESTWNDTFNPGDRSKIKFLMNFIPGLLKAIAAEWFYWVSGQEMSSWFYDSPLSEKGVSQAKGIQTYLQSKIDFMTPKEADLLRLLIGSKEHPSQLVSSNLRRAISTIVIGFQDRLLQNMEKDTVLILTELQEISRNPDALSITPAKGKVLPTWSDPKPLHGLFQADRIDTSLCSGNKPVSTNGLKRMQAFCQIAFEQIENNSIIAGGHSLWFRSFFQTYLPHKFDHICKKKKLINGGIVGFTLERIPIDAGGKEWAYRIDPTSLVVLYGGF